MHTIITPWPPQRNGIADYAFELATRSVSPITILTRALNPSLPGGAIRVISDLDTEAKQLLARGKNLFHFGNNPDHTFAIPHFLKYGGIAVIHDATLHYLIECTDHVIPGFFAATLAREHPLGVEELIRLWKVPGFKRPLDYQEIKMLSWLKTARAVVVHSKYAKRVIGPHLPTLPIHVMPHFAYVSILPLNLAEQQKSYIRHEFGLNSTQFIITTLGFVTENKQYEAIIRAIMLLPEKLRARTKFVIAGEVRIHEYNVRSTAAFQGAEENVIFTGYLDENRMRNIMVASDLICNLRYPTFGESSGSLARSLGLGCGLVVTDNGSYSELPNEVCFKIAANTDPSNELSTLFGELMSDPALLQNQRIAASIYARDALAPSRIAQCYSDLIDA